jgi:hypothetical protein
MRGLMASRWQVGANEKSAETVFVPCSGDLVVTPEHRGRGVAGMLTEALVEWVARDGIPYVFSLSAGVPTRLRSLTMGWRSLGPLATMEEEKQRSPVASRWQAITRRLLSSAKGRRFPFNRLYGLASGQRTSTAGCITVSDQPRPQSMAHLVARIGYDGNLRQVRDEDWFAWRFRNPFARYCFLYLQRGELSAYMVLRSAATDPGKRCTIIDCEAAYPGDISELLSVVLERRDLGPVSAWLSTVRDEGRLTMEQHGFYLWRAERLSEWYPTVLVRPTSTIAADPPWLLGGRDLLEPTTWDLREVYSDGA